MRLLSAVAWLILLIPSLDAQSWTGILDPSRAIDWSATQPGVPGGIPTTRTRCGSTIAAYTGTPAAINNAIAACGENTYVLLGAGTFTLSAGINLGTKNVTLRGSGPTQTILKISAHAATCMMGGLVCVHGGSNVWAGGGSGSWSTSWTAGYSQGTTQITVGSTSNTAAGRMIFLDQLDDQTDSGGLVNGSKINVFSGEGNPSFGRCIAAESCTSATGTNVRTQYHIHKVVSVDSSTLLTITPAIQMPNWRTGQSPQMFGIGTSASDFVVGVGIEDLTVENNGVASTGQNSIIEFANAYGSWAKNVRTIIGLRSHIVSLQSAHIEVRDCYLYGAVGSSSQSYSIESTGASDNLYINNIIHYTTIGFLGPCPGCVGAYNYGFGMNFIGGGNCVDHGNGYSECNWPLIDNTHDSGGGMDLWEGNDASGGMNADLNHGISPLATFFRNRLGGYDDDASTHHYRIAVMVQSFGRAYNFIGNVLGVSGQTTTYESSGGVTDALQVIYELGRNGYGVGGTANSWQDTVVPSSMMRWGNYDTVNAAVRWESSEVPTTGITYINGNSVPSTHTLPNSLFLASKPSWWSTPWATPAWPAIGPDVTGGNVADYDGHVYKIPARLCFENTVDDANYAVTPPIKLFSASSCYLSGSGRRLRLR